MIYIAHRGNLSGPNPEMENRPDYLQKALDAGFSVELDVRWHRDKFWFGHDGPSYQKPDSFDLMDERVYCHCKDLASLELLAFQGAHCFYHSQEEYIVTSKGFVWTHSKSPPLSGLGPSLHTVVVLPEVLETSSDVLKKCLGVCTDYVYDYQSRLE